MKVPPVHVYVVIGITEGDPDAFAVKVFAIRAEAEDALAEQIEAAEQGDHWYLSEQELL